MQHNTDTCPINKWNLHHQFQVIQRKIETVDRTFETKQTALKILKDGYRDKSLNIEFLRYQIEVKRLEGEITNLNIEKVRLRTSTHLLAAKEVGEAKCAHIEDWKYIDGLIAQFLSPKSTFTPIHPKRTQERKVHWQKALIEAYGAQEVGSERIWCPISQSWQPPHLMSHAQIVGDRVTELVAARLFGPPGPWKGHLWNTRNGIPVFHAYQKMLEDGSIAIVPKHGSSDLQVIVLKDSERRRDMDPEGQHDQVPTGSALHGRTLEFLNNYRPGMRYLHFQFAMSLLREQRLEADGWWRRQFGDIWSLSNRPKWVCEALLRKFAIRIGHFSLEEALEFSGGSPRIRPKDSKCGEDDDDDDEVFLSIVQHIYQVQALGTKIN
ncbi:hypothetical protein F4808DRAFT_471226 [Astrocystis sublimbata]|nr:hypothetical protein F4808DRAFT_471226 [Astrocystis sublimbata]